MMHESWDKYNITYISIYLLNVIFKHEIYFMFTQAIFYEGYLYVLSVGVLNFTPVQQKLVIKKNKLSIPNIFYCYLVAISVVWLKL